MKKNDWFCSAAITAVAALFYFFGMADYAFPGESARLMAIWGGLDVSKALPYPLTAFFTGLAGGGNALSPLCGAFCAFMTYVLTVLVMRMKFEGSSVSEKAVIVITRTGGAIAACMFAFSPAVIRSSTILSVQIFNCAWLLAVLFAIVVYINAPKSTAWLLTVLTGTMAGLMLANSLDTLFAAIFTIVVITMAASYRGSNPGLASFLSISFFLVAFLVSTPLMSGSFAESLKTGWNDLVLTATRPGAVTTWLIATFPAFLAYIASSRTFRSKGGVSSWIFHIALSIISILAAASPLSPSSIMEQTGYTPVLTSLFSALLGGYCVSYWCYQFLMAERILKNITLAVGPLTAGVILISCFINIFSFKSDEGAFADTVAGKIISDLGTRKWLVTDGLIDDHLRIAVQHSGKDITLVCLTRDNDELYTEDLRRKVKESNIGGPKNEEILLSLSLGVLTFIQDWIAADPTVGSMLAVFGSPEIWYSANAKPVPELFFFGGDETKAPDWNRWAEISSLLHAPEGWGSYKFFSKYRNPLDIKRLSLRRHMGLMANNRGVYLQDAKKDDEAWKLYELVRNEIDPDNICALFNEFEMARAGHAEASKRKHEIEKSFKEITDDPDRRYMLWQLSNYYGYIRNPEIFVRLGYTWARSGRPGDALAHIRRAIDFIPVEKRSGLLNMMAALYASGSDTVKSREIYENVLRENSFDHDALLGMMRVELLEGNNEKALEYLEKAVKNGKGERARTELAMLHIVNNRYSEAKKLLRAVIDANPGNIQSWSLLATVIMQEADATKDPAAKKKLEKELESQIIPQMEKASNDPFSYHVQIVKAFLLLRKGEDRRREARDAFAKAAKLHPGANFTHDMVLELDISLNDTVDAEYHARNILKRNRRAPLANYVMGSLALQKGDYSSAEAFLRRSADATRPMPLAQNDLAEVLRRQRNYTEARHYAFAAVKNAPKLYVAWETLASILLDSGHKDIDEIEGYVRKALQLGKENGMQKDDIRVLMTLARTLIKKGDIIRAKTTIGRIRSRIDELSDYEKEEFEELRKHVR